MSNPWGVQLKKTGLNEKRNLEQETAKLNLENRQGELVANAALNKENKDVYDDRQGSLAASAMMGKQGRLGGRKRTKKNKKRKHRKSRRNRRR